MFCGLEIAFNRVARNDGGGKVLGKRYCRIVTVDEIKFSSMPERGTIDAVFISRGE